MAADCIPPMHENVDQMVLLLPALNLLQLRLDLVESARQVGILQLKLVLPWQFLQPPLKFLSVALTVLQFLEQYLEMVHLVLDLVTPHNQLLNSIVNDLLLRTVLLHIAVEVYHEVKGELLLVLQHVPLLTVVLRPVYVHEQVLRLLTDEDMLVHRFAIYLHLEGELLVHCAV
jgi:hypothetical protein